MSTLIPADKVHFVNGDPVFPYDEVYACFEDKPILFRLLDKKNSRWAFFNDTTDTIITVNALLGPGSPVKPLQRTELKPVPHEDGTVDDLCALEATLVVEPGFTEVFIEGEPNGFSLTFKSEAAPAKDVTFENGEPSVKYDKIYKCFKDTGNGLLFRLVSQSDRTWYFYNDTKDYVMHVTVDFAVAEEVRLLPPAVLDSTVEPSAPGGCVMRLAVPPLQTLPFMQGTPEVYNLSYAAQATEEEITYLHQGPDRTVIPNLSRVFRCFKEHGNGLLFRLVDDRNHIWGFYNDTEEFVMTANVRLPPDTDVKLAPGVTVANDEENFVVATVMVQPLATAPFLVGDPPIYDLTFSAAPVGEVVAPQAPVYEGAGPDTKVIQAEEVFPCFEGHGNGLVFRLVDHTHQLWGFITIRPTLWRKLSWRLGVKM
ncbi:hypothetical protein AGDE_11622 [Angomonas deanei]|uniref:DUF1935 domain-containing protein n=1 Tax=Angomonas deanei TaxID=59799 RepID=A0A7G2CD68_9TRYP|nr:hypothetical protein AGDE_11622 [Angomonas deanei]CAD2216961.1 Domain of unknown function (DUF1935), putative [Angomonas deanei]|eukprot:EPY25938.1 hypothetical protein AGDE_11622 [Angomonas deanei]